MPKCKTSSAITKRFKITANGNLLRHQAGRSHLLHKKSSRRKKKLSRVVLVKRPDAEIVKAKLLM